MRLYYLQKSLSLVFSIGQRVLQLSDLGNNSMGLVHIIEPSPTRQLLVHSVKKTSYFLYFEIAKQCDIHVLSYTLTILKNSICQGHWYFFEVSEDGVLATLQNDIWYFDKPGLRDLEFGGVFYVFFCREWIILVGCYFYFPPMLSNP